MTTAAFDPTDPAGPAFRSAVGTRTRLFLEQIDQDLTGVSELMHELVALAQRFTSGGKRLRPAFCYWGYAAIDGQPIDRDALLDATVGFELLHVSALVHDDLIDDSDTRRGMPAAHRQLEELHRTRHGIGDPEAFGRAGAIILGDLLAAWSTQRFATAGLEPQAFARARDVLDRVRTDVNVGQFLDIAAEAGLGTADPVADAAQVVEFKTARYTMIRPLQFGAALAGADEAVLAGLERVGSAVGRAFQFRDDLPGVFGAEAVTGKPAGDDLRENKRTVLVLDALDHEPSLGEFLGHPLETSALADAQALLQRSGAVRRLNERIDADAATARRELDSLGLTPEGQIALEALIHAAVDRQF